MEIPEFINDFRKMRKMGGGKQMKLGILCTMINGFGRRGYYNSQEIGLARAASVFFVVYALAMFVTRPFTGRAFDRVGPHPVMVPAFVSFALGMVVLAFAANDWMILGAAALLGFGVGTVQSCGLAMAVRVTSDARLSVANATFYMLLDVGVGVGPILLGIVAPLIGYANLYLCMAVVGALALALFLVVAKTEKGAR